MSITYAKSKKYIIFFPIFQKPIDKSEHLFYNSQRKSNKSSRRFERGGKMNEKSKDAVRAFRKYARLGLTSGTLNPIQKYKRIDMMCVSRRSKLEMLAVFDTFRLLEISGDQSTIYAVNSVYLRNLSHRLLRHDIGNAVRACATEQFCDERTIYRRLEKARELFLHLHKNEGLAWDGCRDEF